LITSSGVFVTQDITASPRITWTQLGAGTTPPNACGVQAAGRAASPVFFVQAGSCSGSAADTIWRYQGINPGGTWQQVNPPAGFGANPGFGLFSIDRNNPKRMLASLISTAAGPRIARSNDSGATWTADTTLNMLMTGNGVYRYQTTQGPVNFSLFGVYAQPTLLAFDPTDANTLLAGAADSGIFLSRDNGGSWATATNNAGTATNPHIPRPHFAYFVRECTAQNLGVESIYVGTQGRGVWRIRHSVPMPVSRTQCNVQCTDEAKTCRDDCSADATTCRQSGGLSGGQCTQALMNCNANCTDSLSTCHRRCATATCSGP
jgi:hypothetical protein